ncbi:heterocycloanthracin/sonorensin family bacteriocin [Brevibacillus panacihumi]|uniref:Heterocycloanthracin/sonorensin family bacteriocin n=1 Tax=Brevibacillus panacihumi TaxID=497735 RepID=A0A3M8CQD0_9BACL|nr:heterocycloanthracin/sonorensin family bacteriocin [Brevibacillus panacihumi]
MDDFKKELKKLKVDKFKGGDVTPWDNESQKNAMLVQGRCGSCSCSHRCSCRCSCSCSCSCSCFCFCSCFFNCFFNCFFRCSRCARCF